MVKVRFLVQVAFVATREVLFLHQGGVAASYLRGEQGGAVDGFLEVCRSCEKDEVSGSASPSSPANRSSSKNGKEQDGVGHEEERNGDHVGGGTRNRGGSTGSRDSSKKERGTGHNAASRSGKENEEEEKTGGKGSQFQSGSGKHTTGGEHQKERKQAAAKEELDGDEEDGAAYWKKKMKEDEQEHQKKRESAKAVALDKMIEKYKKRVENDKTEGDGGEENLNWGINVRFDMADLLEKKEYGVVAAEMPTLKKTFLSRYMPPLPSTDGVNSKIDALDLGTEQKTTYDRGIAWIDGLVSAVKPLLLDASHVDLLNELKGGGAESAYEILTARRAELKAMVNGMKDVVDDPFRNPDDEVKRHMESTEVAATVEDAVKKVFLPFFLRSQCICCCDFPFL